jgi:hypothetical protein
MNYDAKSSGAILSRTGSALSHNFRCDSLAVRALERKFCGKEEWMQLIRAELEAGRPILYGGQDAAEGGHAFVLHGIDEEDNKENGQWDSYPKRYFVDATESVQIVDIQSC